MSMIDLISVQLQDEIAIAQKLVDDMDDPIEFDHFRAYLNDHIYDKIRLANRIARSKHCTDQMLLQGIQVLNEAIVRANKSECTLVDTLHHDAEMIVCAYNELYITFDEIPSMY